MALFKRKDLFRPIENVELPPMPEDEKFGFKDVVAIIIAALSIVLPWVLGIIAVLGLLVWLIMRFAG